MNFGVNSWVWVSPITTENLEALIPKVANLGFDWIELPLEDPDGFDHNRAKELIKAHNLGVSSCAVISPDRDLIHPDTAVRENGKMYMRRCIEVAHSLGATNLVGPIYSAVGRTWQATAEERERDTAVLVETLKELADYASEHDVVLGLEPLNRFETSFINLAEQAIEIIDRVDHPACKIMLDTFHMNIEEKSIGDAIRATGDRLCHLHACENDRGAPGSGNVNWAQIGRALKDIDYNGPIVIESFTADVKTIAKAAAIWRPLAPSQDSLAADGQAFLRNLLAG